MSQTSNFQISLPSRGTKSHYDFQLAIYLKCMKKCDGLFRSPAILFCYNVFQKMVYNSKLVSQKGPVSCILFSNVLSTYSYFCSLLILYKKNIIRQNVTKNIHFFVISPIIFIYKFQEKTVNNNPLCFKVILVFGLYEKT